MKEEIRVPIIGPVGSFIDYPTTDHCMTFYFTGCTFGCKNCHNVELQTYGSTKDSNLFTVSSFIDYLYIQKIKHNTNKIVFMGGEPLLNKNLEFIKTFLNINSEFDVCIYTGYEEVSSLNLEGFTFLKTGGYQKENSITPCKTDSYFQLPSTNQKIYNRDFKLISRKGKYVYD